MSAIPKKKLCWNCEGNVSKDIDNCPYCGVYIQRMDDVQDHSWNPSYKIEEVEDEEDSEIPTPPFPVNIFSNRDASENALPVKNSNAFLEILNQIKTDLLPILLLMGGCLFSLFGIVLILFSQNGKLILQWNADYWIYFLSLGLPALIVGWFFLQKNEEDVND